MARMKFLCDADRCIECNACVTACKNEHDVPWGINRRRVVTIGDGPSHASLDAEAKPAHLSRVANMTDDAVLFFEGVYFPDGVYDADNLPGVSYVRAGVVYG